MNCKYVCSIITPRSGGAVLEPKLRGKIDYVDITGEQFKKDYEGSLYMTGSTEDEAKYKAEDLLNKYKQYLQNLSNLMDKF